MQYLGSRRTVLVYKGYLFENIKLYLVLSKTRYYVDRRMYETMWRYCPDEIIAETMGDIGILSSQTTYKAMLYN